MSQAPPVPRRGRAVPAVVAAVVLGAAGVTVAIDVISVQTGRHALIYPYRQIAAQLRSAHWDDWAVMAVAAAFALVGLVLLLAAVIPGKPRAVAIGGPAPDVAVSASRRSVRRAMRAAALSVDGISTASARLRRKSVHVAATTRLRDDTGLVEQLEGACGERLAQLAPSRPLDVTVHLRTKEH